MGKSRNEKLKGLNSLSKKQSLNSKWKEVARWNRLHAEALHDYAIIAARILQALKNRGLKQADLAKLLDVTPQALTRIVKGRQNLTLQTIRRIEDVLNISLISVHKKDSAILQDKVKFVPVQIHLHYRLTSRIYDGAIDRTKEQESTGNINPIKSAS